MGAALVVTAIIFITGFAVGGVLVITLPVLTGRRTAQNRKRTPGGGTIQAARDDTEWPDLAPDERTRWPEDDNGYSRR